MLLSLLTACGWSARSCIDNLALAASLRPGLRPPVPLELADTGTVSSESRPNLTPSRSPSRSASLRASGIVTCSGTELPRTQACDGTPGPGIVYTSTGTASASYYSVVVIHFIHSMGDSGPIVVWMKRITHSMDEVNHP
jgi:hypothetical protein